MCPRFQRGVYPAEDFSPSVIFDASCKGAAEIVQRQEIWPQYAGLETFCPIPRHALTKAVTSDDQVKAYIKKIMSQLNKWMLHGKISTLVVVITDKETDEHIERWQFDVRQRVKHTGISLTLPGPTLQQVHQEGFLVQVNRQRELRARVSPFPLPPPARVPNKNSRDVETPKDKTEKEIQEEIQAIFRQITASVTFLPQLDGNCTFNVLVYADADSEVPLEWGDSDAKEIKDGEKVQLRSFSTSNHKVDTLVSYR